MSPNPEEENAILISQKVQEVLATPKKIVVVLGTHQLIKCAIGLRALINISIEHPGNYLVRLLHLDLVNGGFERDIEVQSFIEKLVQVRAAKFRESRWFLDTVKESSQNGTPRKLDGAIFYAAEHMAKHSDQIERIAHHLPEHGKIVLATWTDNQDIAWMRGLNATYVLVQKLNEAEHKAMLAFADHLSDEDYSKLTGAVMEEQRQTWQSAIDAIHVGNYEDSLANTTDRHCMNRGLKELYKAMMAKGQEPMSCGDMIAYLTKSGWNLKTAKEAATIWQRILDKPSISLPQSACIQEKGTVRKAYDAACKIVVK